MDSSTSNFDQTQVTPPIGSRLGPPDAADAMDHTMVSPMLVASKGPSHSLGDRFGRYEIVKKLGEGGMGAVFQARDTETGSDVALKVLAAGFLSNRDALRRFEKEARLLEEAKSPHVANLLDIGSEGETRYLVMEFVRGGDLRNWMKTKEEVSEASSLEIVGDLCKALVTAHAKTLVHRDIKPENILLDMELDADHPVVKLTDFGLARHVDQSESLKLTQTGALLGTPYYMSPEQFNGAHPISPATDVYAIGATLFELLTGRRPFTAGDPIQLASAHCFDIPDDVRKLNPRISDATADLVRRMLAKLPGQRPPDASAVLEEIVRVQSGDSNQFTSHPVVPDHDPTKTYQADFEYDLTSSPSDLWMYVGNTDRFNQAAGLPSVVYQTSTDANGQIRKVGQIRLAGMTIHWEEHPFEWIEGQRFSVLREFSAGPFTWFVNCVELVAKPDGGTRLKHHVRIQPRNVIGKILAQVEVGVKGKRNFDRIYHRIDNVIRSRSSSLKFDDPFVAAAGLKKVQRLRLEDRLDEWRECGVAGEIIETMEQVIVHSSQQDLARIRPLSVANRYGLSGPDVVDACLRAVPIGLLTLHWDIICPTCRLASSVKDTLREIEQHANCAACQIDFDVEFGSSLELVFRTHPEIRSPDLKIYCAGGPGNFPHVVARVRLEPNEHIQLQLSLNAGSYVVRGPNLPYAIPIEVEADAGPRHGRICCIPGLNRTPEIILRAGHQTVALENQFSFHQTIRIERIVRRSEALTADRATALPVFRELFPEQTLASGTLFEVARSSFLVVQVEELEALFGELGDAGAYPVIQEFDRLVEKFLQRSGGSIVSSSPGTVFAGFPDPVMAIRSARAILPMLAEQKSARPWKLSGAIHRGAALVIGDRNETRYFGAAINRTLQLSKRADAGELLLSSEIWSDPDVIEQFQGLIRRDTTGDESVQRMGINQ